MKLVVSFALLLFTLSAFSQKLEPVKWSFEAIELTELDEKDVYQVNMTATIDDGWYIYAQEIDEGGPIPTSFEFHTGRNPVEILDEVKEIGEAKEGIDPMFEIFIKKYAHEVVFTTTAKSNGAKELNGSLQYMCCDNSRCLPPEIVNFSIKLP